MKYKLLLRLRARWPWLAVVTGIVALAAFLRIWQLNEQQLWYDEIWTVNTSMHGPLAAVRLTAQDTNPPLFYVLESIALAVLGLGDTDARALPVAVGVMSALVMYLAGTRLLGRQSGAWAAALFAVSGVAVWYAQEARMYSLLMLLSAVLLWTFGLLLEKPTTARTVCVGVILACIAYTHVFGYFVGPLLLGAVLLVPRLRQRAGRQTLTACAIALALFLPWLFVLPTQVEYVRSRVPLGSWWMKPPTHIARDVIDTLSAFSPGQQALASALFIGLMIAGVAAPPGPNTSSRQPARTWPEENEASVAYVLAILALGPLVIGLAISKYVTPIYTLRNALVALPAAYLLAVHGALKYRRAIGYLLLSVVFAYGLISHPHKYPNTSRGTWYDAAVTVSQDPRSAVLVDHYSDAASLIMYPRIREREPSLNVVWTKRVDQRDATGSLMRTEAEDVTVWPLRTVRIAPFLARFDTVYVVSRGQDSDSAEYLQNLPGWRLKEQKNSRRPVIRVYTRTD